MREDGAQLDEIFFEMGWLKNNNLGNVSPGLQGLFDDCWQS